MYNRTQNPRSVFPRLSCIYVLKCSPVLWKEKKKNKKRKKKKKKIKKKKKKKEKKLKIE